MSKATKNHITVIKEFKEFINKGSVIDLAVGIIVGAAFGKIVSSLVNDILMPLIGIILGGSNFSNLSINIGNTHIAYGSFMQNIIDFLIIAFCVFMIVKLVNKFNRNKAKNGQMTDKEKTKKREDEQLAVLKEIRDRLKK